jgi:hypothetical protein
MVKVGSHGTTLGHSPIQEADSRRASKVGEKELHTREEGPETSERRGEEASLPNSDGKHA